MELTDRPVWRSRVWPAACAILAMVGLLLATIGVDPPVAAITAVAGAIGVGAAVLTWALLRTRRERRAYEASLTGWAAERAAQAERLRIARELHDLASHGLGLITVRVAAARSVRGPAGEAERASALADIERAGREATTELRRMLTVLRTDREAAPLRPAETLDALPSIVAGARAGGVDAALEIDCPGPVSAGVQVTVCTLVREGLANAARHAGPTRVRVEVRAAGAEVSVTVADEGPVPGWRPQPGAGQGLIGLHERIDVLGGSLEVDAREPGFRLSARLPDPEAR